MRVTEIQIQLDPLEVKAWIHGTTPEREAIRSTATDGVAEMFEEPEHLLYQPGEKVRVVLVDGIRSPLAVFQIDPTSHHPESR